MSARPHFPLLADEFATHLDPDDWRTREYLLEHFSELVSDVMHEPAVLERLLDMAAAREQYNRARDAVDAAYLDTAP